ncbi:TlpA family protein disulfide reductase [Bdellovibrio svalbardensis]|uniref:TlpA family protein disulfide reductase n=1 Tax=Bdellovibrio svalbardensis TaxID=2972972 RepID=A0ABT6DJM5_9BACT|nr:TlpA disulfide reductase family protein [Bdellovibrio svalbardensis]MDG0816692.1 TlpA family protein disulfide reductase [Bdellovibrio svalbardensis]
MKKALNLISNILLAAMVIFLITTRLPGMIEHYRQEGATAPDFTISLLQGKSFTLNENKEPLVIVFWATWCGPCEVELSRLNNLIIEKKIKAESVLTISSLEDPTLVQKTVSHRQYQFAVGLDPSGKVAKDYKVAGTPTLVFVDREKKIKWLSTGLSPTLELRVTQFLKK